MSAPPPLKAFLSLPRLLQAYIAVITAAASVILVYQALAIEAEKPELFYPVLVTSVVLAATKIRLPLLPSSATVSLSYCTNFAALALFRPFAATFIIAVSVWAQCALNNAGRQATYRTVFSIANIVVATAIADWAGGFVGDLSVKDDWTLLVVPTLAGATAFFFANTLLLAQAVALESKKSPVVLWREQFLWSAPACFVGAIVGVSAAYLIHTASTLAAFAAVPIVLFYWGYRTYLGFIEKQDSLHLATVEALARAIGARDQTLEASKTVSDTHVRRVQRLAVTLARRAGMSDHEVKGVEVAALLHDIGKLAVPEHILNKPAKLTPEERKLIHQHPTVGAEIIGAVDFGYPVATLIASHHERWNGEGYPKGLRGDDIPLGSRILGIVDYFDALIADRPYHKAKPEAEARLIIQEEGGSALDPSLVKMFLEILEEEMPLAEATLGAGARVARAGGRASRSVCRHRQRRREHRPRQHGNGGALLPHRGDGVSPDRAGHDGAHRGAAAAARASVGVGALRLRRRRRRLPLRVRHRARFGTAATDQDSRGRRRDRLRGAARQDRSQRAPLRGPPRRRAVRRERAPAGDGGVPAPACTTAPSACWRRIT